MRALFLRSMTTMSKTSKVPISGLPLPPSSQIITNNLTPDPNTPSAAGFIKEVLLDKPSIQRRARLLPSQAHFAYVSPLPLPFPYEITAPDPPEVVEDKAAYIEKWLSDREAVISQSIPADTQTTPVLQKYHAKSRDDKRELIGLSETCLRDCIPHLDVGDAFATLGSPALAPEDEEGVDSVPVEGPGAIRQELIDVLSGHSVLMSADSNANNESPGFAPWSVRYSGHQFGSWAGQLGDGRAISVLVTPHPTSPDLTYELQLKGAGRTPFSRSADGLAVLRSSIREYLCSEAMQALSIPTTRSLSLISLPDLPVIRERVETACVFTRVAESFLRIGNFEALSPPSNMFFLGGGQQSADYDALRQLGEWVGRKVLKLENVDWDKGKSWGKELVLDVAKRNAKMVAAWQAYGFMHGVMNTDNISVLGLTIDYGPYAFMDVFDSYHICNHTDEEGRYAYKYQPNMIVYACRALLRALSPLIGAEANLRKAVSPGWAQDVSDEKITEWRNAGTELVKDEMEKILEETCAVEYGRLFRKRLALRRQDKTDQSQIFQPFLDIMETHKLDFHSTFRKLCFFRPSMLSSDSTSNKSQHLDKFISSLFSCSPDQQRLDHTKATEDWLAWLEKYSKRIESERSEWSSDMDTEREAAAKGANPRFILRQWVLEEVIKKVEGDHESGKRILAKVMQMACNPFEPWGAEDEETPITELEAEIKEERRFCGLGEKKMLGFQCSCSS
ncbi:hypothetical protein SERLA73DRAFT_181640 [Serpula lacrymans var. lacrymans S7.3]|uniref:Selenoprotein O n=2 Tax=Serpula lacrymans var. lacrymans TaxID=341189 RepID=F8PYF2_SERL3|nr:uncharacterized protein SERLADRAFT_467929 [Serpula lacrymans var. lacrymans S7.9]EGN98915.1 hypothetical protein SERLA73DRAFT_181640 [Serpula lacrymans var. lacrymans S7.3]EGO24505.1 hypothetical protein SERLADRAFT_467929 [Serpula lacrymans var. lacrymans S7.9]